jgi:hypothetical protein
MERFTYGGQARSGLFGAFGETKYTMTPSALMRVVCIAMAITRPLCGSEPDACRIRECFKSDNYTVTWGTARAFDSDAELETGVGNGHGFTLGWMRFVPGTECVDVLSVQLIEGWQPYQSKWPPDRAPVTVKHAQMKPEAYATLLRDLAVVESAELKPIQRNGFSSSSNDFWVNARLTEKGKTLVDLNWAGYGGATAQLQFAKPQAGVALATEAVKGLGFKEHTLTEEERNWASTKFARDWKRFKDLESHWWVRERYIITIGVVGDATALPMLRDILESEPKDRCAYYAINAVTRLMKTDLRDKPVEEMDVEETRRKVLGLLRDGK